MEPISNETGGQFDDMLPKQALNLGCAVRPDTIGFEEEGKAIRAWNKRPELVAARARIAELERNALITGTPNSPDVQEAVLQILGIREKFAEMEQNQEQTLADWKQERERLTEALDKISCVECEAGLTVENLCEQIEAALCYGEETLERAESGKSQPAKEREGAGMSEEGFTCAEAIRWIRHNCLVDTGDGIAGIAGSYTEERIGAAIRSWSDKWNGKKAPKGFDNPGR